ncbi:MAG: twin-arginine translocation signal domain-containing protein [Planctomycetota bacterium]|jgi:hypothetical protein
MRKSKQGDISRRRFLKAAAAGALGASSIPMVIIPRRAEAYEPGARIHPYIEPFRVVGATAPRMTTGTNVNASWQQQEGLVSAEAIWENMDKLAMTLAEESSAVDAWKKIFVKPAGKSWADATVAVKTNQIDRQRTRAPVMGKVCHVLTDVVGVKGSNIHIYDACHGGDGWSGNSIGRENLFKDLPEGVHAADRWGGFNLETSLPAPYFAGERKTKCLDHLVRGEVATGTAVARTT